MSVASPSERSTCRPVRRRTRTFRPNYLSFAGTYQCNLTCPHCCVPIEWTDRLDIGVALRFLEDAHRHGIEHLGFTGGEPFLYVEFLLAICKRAAKLRFRFDKIMSNGVWFRDDAHLDEVLQALRDSGFDGKLGLSVDKFHGVHGVQTGKLARFCRAARRIFERDNIVSISYASRRPDQGLEPIHVLARELDGIVSWSELLGRYLLVAPTCTMTLNWNHLAPVERAEKLSGAWDGQWFQEDYCEGPGQALIVNPRGEVKPCCGFASDLEQLTIGNIHRDSVSSIIRRARKHPYVGKVFREGLTAIRDEVLARDPNALPGATSNHCFFCWHVLTQNLIAVPAGPTGNSSQRRTSLPMASATEAPLAAPRPGKKVTALLMAFDGKTVFLGKELAPEWLHKGRVYAVNILGRALVEAPPARLTWTDYQAWIDRLRAEGYTLTTHDLSPCRRSQA